MSVVNTLNEAGFNVEITALWRNKSDGHQVHIDTVIKESDMSWSPSSVAFALCNDAFQRRLMWNVCTELATQKDRNAEALMDTFGNGRDEKGKDFDLYYGYMDSDIRWTKDGALHHIIEETKQQMKNFKN